MTKENATGSSDSSPFVKNQENVLLDVTFTEVKFDVVRLEHHF